MNNAKGGTMNGHPVTIREAILKAADHIERNPGEFEFMEVWIPSATHCGTPGCALGWIGFFANGDAPAYGDRGLSEIDVPPLLGLEYGTPYEFYDRLTAFVIGWRHSAPACARALRLYADKYHPAEPVATDTDTDTDATPNAVASWAGGAWTPERVRA